MGPLSVLVALAPGESRDGFVKLLSQVYPDARFKAMTEEEAMRTLAHVSFDIVVAEPRPGHRQSDLLVIATRNAPRTARILVSSARVPASLAASAHAKIAPPFGAEAARALAGILGLVAYFRSLAPASLATGGDKARGNAPPASRPSSSGNLASGRASPGGRSPL